MNYRRFGKLNWNVSALGFGAMRLPIKGADAARINEPEAIRMIRYAIDHGVNYVDTAYVYHRGKSESVVGKALKDGYREKTRLATKLPTWMVNSQQDMDHYLEEQLSRLQTESLDFYLLHGLSKKVWVKLKKLNVLDWIEQKLHEGAFSHIGFSFHDEYAVFKDILDTYDGWDFCQIQYNYVDTDFQAGTIGLKYAASKGLAVVIMEPIAGGRLAITPPKQIQAIWDSSDIKRTPAAWALKWVWNQPEVSVVLSGMSTMSQVKENVENANHSAPGDLTPKELALIEQVKRKYSALGFAACTGCRYCLPCPEGVNIPEIMALYNEYYVKNRSDEIESKYWEHITPESQAKRCSRCGKCEELCPQKLPVRNILAEAAFIFEQKT
jgi:predicted aldo/keto reductase-like oxidoreductase